MRKIKKTIVSIDLVIGGDHVKGVFRASTNLNENFTSGKNLTIILSLAHVKFKKENGVPNRGQAK